MPGVPSGRGCNSCRKQKKKCDQVSPACARCTRLGIECVGAGRQRFKFIHQTASEPSGAPPDPPFLRLVPSSQTALIAGNFISKLQIDDARYDVKCYGSFLRLLPGRIGTNMALDVAVDAFSTACNNLHSEESRFQSMSKHGLALRALREALDSPSGRKATETVCAIYLVMITEVLVGADSGRHTEGLAYILQHQAHNRWKSRFELEMFSVMCFAVIVETIGNPRLKPDPWLPQVLDQLEPIALLEALELREKQLGEDNANHFPSLFLRSISAMTRLIQDPGSRHAEIRFAFQAFLRDKAKLERSLQSLDHTRANDQQRLAIEQLRGLRMLQLAMVQGLALVANRILQEFEPHDSALLQDGEGLVQGIVTAGEQAIPRKPLGSGYARPVLGIAWAATRDPEQKAYIALLLETLAFGFQKRDHMAEARVFEKTFARVHTQVAEAQTTALLAAPVEGEGNIEEIVQPQCYVQ